MKKILGLLMAMIMCAGVITGCGSSKDVGSGGLGKLEIDDTTVPSIGGGDGTTTAPTAPSDTPTEPATEPPTEPQKVATRYYSDENFSAMIPADWDVYSYKFDDGTGNYRLLVSIYDPTDRNNCVFFMSGLEPFFTSEADRKKVSRFEASLTAAPVIDELEAVSVLENWDGIMRTLRTQGFVFPNYVGNYSVQQVSNSEIIKQENNRVTSAAEADSYAEGSDNVYTMLFFNTFAPFYNAYLNVTWYISYSNLGYALNADLYDEYMPILEECITSLDFSAFNSSNKVDAEGSDTGMLSNSDIKNLFGEAKKMTQE